jgi:hypothetical protein
MSSIGAIPLSTGAGMAGGRGSVCQISSAPAAVVSSRPAARPIRNLVIDIPPLNQLAFP